MDPPTGSSLEATALLLERAYGMALALDEEAVATDTSWDSTDATPTRPALTAELVTVLDEARVALLAASLHPGPRLAAAAHVKPPASPGSPPAPEAQ